MPNKSSWGIKKKSQENVGKSFDDFEKLTFFFSFF